MSGEYEFGIAQGAWGGEDVDITEDSRERDACVNRVNTPTSLEGTKWIFRNKLSVSQL